MFAIGSKVKDLPTNTATHIVEVKIETVDGQSAVFFRLSDNVPLSATFPTRWRNHFELDDMPGQDWNAR